MKQRNQIEEKYKWDLTEYFKDDNAWKEAFENIKPKYETLATYCGKLSNDTSLLECLKLNKELNEITSRLYVYISLKIKEDGKNNFYQDLSNKLQKYLSDISPSLSFIASELNEINDEHLTELALNPNFKDFDLDLKDVIRNKPHMLSAEQEKLMAQLSECIGGAEDVFDMIDAVDIKFEDVEDENGNKFPLNNSNYSVYMQGENETLRKAAFKNLNGAYGKLNYSLAANYLNNIKTNSTLAKVRKFDSAFKASLFEEDVNETVYNTLVQEVSNNVNVFHRYYSLKQKALGLKEFHNYDINAKLKTKVPKKYTYEQAYDLVLNATSVFGADYTNILQQAKDCRWIDVMPNENKDTGAFSWGAYGAHPVVLLNYEETINSVFTLAHELGHMMHTYYSNTNNPSTKAGYEIFVAEVASTVNEMILAKTLLKNAQDKQEKLFYIDYIMNMFYATVCRQTMFAEFEYMAHNAYENSEDVTTDALNNMYHMLAQKYFGEKVSLVDELKYEWSRIPHFYSSFYVYKYATGLISALAISNNILNGENGAIENYKAFLSSGCTKDPVELLKIAGVDLTEKDAFVQAFKFISSILDEWENMQK